MSLTLEAPLAAETVTAPRSERAATVTTAVLELTVRVSAAGNAEAAAKGLVDGLCHQVQADQVVFAVRRQNSPALKLVASSAVRQLSPSAPWVQDLARVLNESCGDDLCWLDDCPLFAEFGESSRIARLEFHTADGTSVGAAIAVWTNAARAGAAEPLLRLASHALAPVLALHARSSLHAWSARIVDCLPPWLTRRYRWALLGSVIVALAAPWPYTIKAQVTLEPVEHRFVCAPFEGVFEQSLAQPGDQVEPGQVLGRMDGRELRTKLAALDAELARVTRSRDSNQATNKLAAAQIDRLEMERLTQERDLIERRMQQLEIRAPIGGVIVSGDLRRHAGATVNVGHTLYEVAPLER
ncbi:MAG: efflux RND transporter periplasmic adaptor subunit, partial [Planctomycetaceae bacterium]|nr:efflux RND transporter periplasmic adaptor subunit [Planctomycetaceae bacterium]